MEGGAGASFCNPMMHPIPIPSPQMLVRTWTVKDIKTQEVLYEGPKGPALNAAVWKGKRGGRKVSITSFGSE
tara:strand:+ start:184 stop:399 length:216 start_codon:yes stop_codon:yes gene_type:complete